MKRRVIAIAVVLAAVGVGCAAMNRQPPWRAVMLKKVVETKREPLIPGRTYVELHWEQRWGREHGKQHGGTWRLSQSGSIAYRYANAGYGLLEWSSRRGGEYGSVMTCWDETGEVVAQFRYEANGFVSEKRRSPPWWPHPPLIDLREFEE